MIKKVKGLWKWIFKAFFIKRKSLKLGLYGPPNAGKSTLANRVCKDWLGQEMSSVIDSDIINIDDETDEVIIDFPCINEANPDEAAAAYTVLKEEWHYPLNKEFQIFMVPKSEPRYTLDEIYDVCNQTEPFAQANVFVQERIDVTVDKLGNRKPVRINMRVW